MKVKIKLVNVNFLFSQADQQIYCINTIITITAITGAALLSQYILYNSCNKHRKIYICSQTISRHVQAYPGTQQGSAGKKIQLHHLSSKPDIITYN